MHQTPKSGMHKFPKQFRMNQTTLIELDHPDGTQPPSAPEPPRKQMSTTWMPSDSDPNPFSTHSIIRTLLGTAQLMRTTRSTSQAPEPDHGIGAPTDAKIAANRTARAHRPKSALLRQRLRLSILSPRSCIPRRPRPLQRTRRRQRSSIPERAINPCNDIYCT